ncbi:hypothetical protein J6590_063517 [Homalodisca vitripennis]|nr:hypothetical protein J6590_063517 [Homalodisca vitripennis]
MLDSLDKKEKEQNRASLKRIIDTTIFCGENEIPLRGHWATDGRKPFRKGGQFSSVARVQIKLTVTLRRHVTAPYRNTVITLHYPKGRAQNLVIRSREAGRINSHEPDHGLRGVLSENDTRGSGPLKWKPRPQDCESVSAVDGERGGGHRLVNSRVPCMGYSDTARSQEDCRSTPSLTRVADVTFLQGRTVSPRRHLRTNCPTFQN